MMSEIVHQRRERQTVQNLERVVGACVEFALDGTVRALRQQEVDVAVVIPSRVEGRFRTKTVKRAQLGEVAIAHSLGELLYNEQQQVDRNAMMGGDWTMDDIPADVRAVYDIWVKQHDQALMGDLAEAAEATLAAPVDRMAATGRCLDCQSADHRYACRTSGWSRDLYTYPLMCLRDMQTGEVYEVPFDAALYVATHPVLFTEETVGAHDGKLSSVYCAGVQSDTVSAEYVVRATDGRIRPASKEVSIAPDGVHLQKVRVVLDHWTEEGVTDMRTARLVEKELPAPRIIESLQAIAIREYAERVTSVPYNHILESVQQALGASGLTLAFNWRYMGMGESDPFYQALSANRVGVSSWTGLDAHAALVRAAESLGVVGEGEYDERPKVS